MQKLFRFLKPHRFARLVAWALAMLAWLADVLDGVGALTGRHLRQRWRFLSLARLSRFICLLAIIRAAEIAKLRPRRRVVRDCAPAGFRRRTTPRALVRACIGARLRKAMKRGDLAARIRFLATALADIDAFARRYIVPRALRRLTKLFPIVLIAPPATAIPGAPAHAPALADSS